MTLLMLIYSLLDKYSLSQVSLLRDKLIKNGMPFNKKKKLIIIMRKSVNSSTFMAVKENKKSKSTHYSELNLFHKSTKNI
jgi:hypothetical protein